MPRAEFIGGPLHDTNRFIADWCDRVTITQLPKFVSNVEHFNEHRRPQKVVFDTITYSAVCVLPDRIVFLFRDERTKLLERLMQGHCWPVAYFLWRESMLIADIDLTETLQRDLPSVAVAR